MKAKQTKNEEGLNTNFYQCDTPRIGALTKMLLDREHVAYRRELTSTKTQYAERYYVDAIRDNHWRENKAMLLECEMENDPVLKARFDHEVAVMQVYFEQG